MSVNDLVRNKEKYNEFFTYWRTIAENNRYLGHSETERHFTRFDIMRMGAEKVTGLKSPYMALEDPVVMPPANNTGENIQWIWSSAVTIAREVRGGDEAALQDARREALVILQSIMRKLKRDREENRLVFFDFRSVRITPIAEHFRNCVGYRMTFNLPSQFDLSWDDDEWDNEPAGEEPRPFATVNDQGEVVKLSQGESWVCTQLMDGTALVLNSNGDEIASVQVPNGATVPVNAPDVELTGDNGANHTYPLGSVPSGVPATVAVQPATVRLVDTDDNELAQVTAPSGVETEVAAPDATLKLNNSLTTYPIRSGELYNMLVRLNGQVPQTFSYAPLTKTLNVLSPLVTLAVSNTTPNVGDTITLTATATGFTATSYTFYLTDGVNIILLSEAQVSNILNYTVVLSGGWEVRVLATDGTGRVWGTVSYTAAAVFYRDEFPANLTMLLANTRESSVYAGSVLRARTGSSEQNIGFSGNLRNNAALIAFAPTGTGTMPTWYDQSLTGVNALQTTAGNQPRVIQSGVPEEVNGFDAVYFDGTDDFMTQATMDSALRINNQPFTFHCVVRKDSGGAATQHIWSMTSGNGNSFHDLRIQDNGVLYLKRYNGAATDQGLYRGGTMTNLNLVTVDYDGATGRVWVGNNMSSVPMSGSFSNTMNTLQIGSRLTTSRDRFFVGKLATAIFHNASQFAAGTIQAQMDFLKLKYGL